jgi:hypothetical protein
MGFRILDRRKVCLNGLELISKLVDSVAWPLVVIFVMYMLREHLWKIVDRLRTLKASKDGLEVDMGEASKEVIGKELPPEKEKEVQQHQILASGENASGAYKLYSNGMIVARRKVTLLAGHTAHHLTFPVAMVNEATSVQFVGDAYAKVTSMNKYGVEFVFDQQLADRTIEIIITGL